MISAARICRALQSARVVAGVVASLTAVGLAGCAADGGPGGDVEGPVAVYVSLPMSGPSATEGRDAADGARLAFAANAVARHGADIGELRSGLGVTVTYLDGAAGGDAQVAAAANARRAVQDSSSAGYIGELDSAPARNSSPILNVAGIATVSPGAGADDLTVAAPGYPGSPGIYRTQDRVTFARVVPRDSLAATVAARPGLERADTMLAPSRLPGGRAFVARFTRRFGREPGPAAAYGFEAMALLLQSIEAADGPVDGFRGRVSDEVLSAVRTHTPLGDYAIGNQGDTSLCLVQPYMGEAPDKPVCAQP